MPKGEKKRTKSANTKAASSKRPSSPRVRKGTKKQEKKAAKKELASRSALPGSFRLTIEVMSTLKKFWRPLGGIFLVFLILNLIFAGSLIGNFRDIVSGVRDNTSPASEFSRALDGFSGLLTGNSNSQNSSSVQTVLLVLGSLTFIWAIRQLLAGEKTAVKEAYYKSMAPLIPFLLILLVIVLQAIPMVIGIAAFSLVVDGYTAGNALVGAGFGLLFIVFTTWSLYMLSSSIFAAYIVTLPAMQPMRALRSAKNLARFRRWQVMRKVLFLPFSILILMGLIIVPLLIFASFLVAPVFFFLSMITVLYAHVYLYSLYKRMLA